MLSFYDAVEGSDVEEVASIIHSSTNRQEKELVFVKDMLGILYARLIVFRKVNFTSERMQ